MASVTFYTYDSSDETRETQVPGVTVFVFTEDGTTFIDSGNTDSSGEVVFELPVETYWVRFFKAGFSFAKKLSVVIEEDSIFDVAGQDLDARPPATQANLCRVSGFLIGAAGQRLPDVTIDLMLTDYVRISGGMATGNAKVLISSDGQGYVEFDLLRGARYDVVVESYGEQVFHVMVPDLPATGFTELVWPYVAYVDVPSSAVTLAAGDDVEITINSVLSSGLVGPYPKNPDSDRLTVCLVSAKSSDPTVATVTQKDNVLTVVGVSPGECEIQFAPSIAPARRFPALPTSLNVISLTVT
jgi:hypothetical protein